MRVVLVVQLGWSGLLRAILAQLGVLVAHLDQNGVLGAWSTVARSGRGLRVRERHRRRSGCPPFAAMHAVQPGPSVIAQREGNRYQSRGETNMSHIITQPGSLLNSEYSVP
eukprot:scaffold26149_cov42-Phaeocystis_antarctica.AAC.1